jgi:hypothetical protein
MSKVKIKLRLCLTKHHAMKAYSVLNLTSHHEDVSGSGNIIPRHLYLTCLLHGAGYYLKS